MPLRAVQGDLNVLAYEKSESEWAEIKRTYKEKGLRMPCCSSLAVPKTSSLGNFFFSHQARGECTSAPESPEHIYLKTIVAVAAIDAGWQAITEFRGASPSGEQWVADVYCTRGSEVKVLEIQLSRQAPDEFLRRHRLYSESNVKALWLASKYNRKRLHSSLQIPIFELETVELGKQPKVADFNAPVTSFVAAVLSGLLRWRVDPITVLYVQDQCWRCRQNIFNIRGWVKDGREESVGGFTSTGQLLLRIRSELGNDCLRALGLSVVESVEKTRNVMEPISYCNACASCGALQNNRRLFSVIQSKKQQIGEVVYRPPFEGNGYWKLLKIQPNNSLKPDVPDGPPA